MSTSTTITTTRDITKIPKDGDHLLVTISGELQIIKEITESGMILSEVFYDTEEGYLIPVNEENMDFMHVFGPRKNGKIMMTCVCKLTTDTDGKTHRHISFIRNSNYVNWLNRATNIKNKKLSSEDDKG